MTDRERVARAILAHKVPLPHGDIEWALLFLSELVKDRTGRWTPEVRADAVELLNLLAASAADAALAALSEHLSDPVAVHANMLTGRIARPTLDQIRHLYPELAPTWRRIPDDVREGEAPWDGHPVDLWCVAQGINAGPGREPDCWFYGGKWWRYSECGNDMCREEVFNATHYAPLPAPPAGEVG